MSQDIIEYYYKRRQQGTELSVFITKKESLYRVNPSKSLRLEIDKLKEDLERIRNVD